MKETETVHILLAEIASLSSRGESGRLQITAGTTRGAFFFKQGKLVDARMGPFTGLPAVNLAVSIGETQLSFDPSIHPPLSSFIAKERTLLKLRFGIDVGDNEEIGHPTVRAQTEEHIRETAPQGSSLKTTLPEKAVSVSKNDAAETINQWNPSTINEVPSLVETSRYSIQAQAVSSITPPLQSQEIPAVVSMPIPGIVNGSLKQNRREKIVLSACVIFLIVVAGAVAAGSYWKNGKPTQTLDAQRPVQAEKSYTPPSIPDAVKSTRTVKAVSAEPQPPLNNAEARINLDDAKSGRSEVHDRIIKNTRSANSTDQNMERESVDKPTSRTIEVMVRIEDGHVTEAYVPNPQVGLAAYEATALRIARERRYPKDTSRKQSLTLKVTKN